jgi:hypothetical protein
MSKKTKLVSRKLLYLEIAAAINARDVSDILSADTLKAYPGIESRNVMRRVVADVASYCIAAGTGLKEDVW